MGDCGAVTHRFIAVGYHPSVAWLEVLSLSKRVRFGRSDVSTKLEAGALVEIPEGGIGFGCVARPSCWAGVPWVQLGPYPDISVGRHHTMVCFEDGVWWVKHSGTTNPTYLNGSPVAYEARLEDGDEIGVVDAVVLRFRAKRPA